MRMDMSEADRSVVAVILVPTVSTLLISELVSCSRALVIVQRQSGSAVLRRSGAVRRL